MRTTFKMAVAAVSIALGAGGALLAAGPLLDRLSPEREDAGDADVRAAAVDAVPAEEREFVEHVPAIGSTRAIRSVELTARTAGVVADLDLPTGQRVEAGYVLVQLDDRAERALFRQVEARLGDARAAVERARQLAQRNVAADATLETAEAALALVEAEAESAQVAVEDRRITAPFAGTVGLTDLELGQRLEPTEAAVSLDDLSAVEVLFTLPETLYGQVRIGQPLRATGSGDGRVFEGEVETMGTRIDPAGRFFEVRGRFRNEDGALAPGMFMNVELVLDTRRSVAVPEVALVHAGTRTLVFVALDGEARERAVRTGLHRDGTVEILEGLEAGETVIVTGLQEIADGDPVSVAGENGGDDRSASIEGAQP